MCIVTLTGTISTLIQYWYNKLLLNVNRIIYAVIIISKVYLEIFSGD